MQTCRAGPTYNNNERNFPTLSLRRREFFSRRRTKRYKTDATRAPFANSPFCFSGETAKKCCRLSTVRRRLLTAIKKVHRELSPVTLGRNEPRESSRRFGNDAIRSGASDDPTPKTGHKNGADEHEIRPIINALFRGQFGDFANGEGRIPQSSQ